MPPMTRKWYIATHCIETAERMSAECEEYFPGANCMDFAPEVVPDDTEVELLLTADMEVA